MLQESAFCNSTCTLLTCECTIIRINDRHFPKEYRFILLSVQSRIAKVTEHQLYKLIQKFVELEARNLIIDNEIRFIISYLITFGTKCFLIENVVSNDNCKFAIINSEQFLFIQNSVEKIVILLYLKLHIILHSI